jgi:hypothetical protein
MHRIDVLAILSAVALLVVIVELVRRRVLSERYSLLWLLTGTVLVGLSCWRPGLDSAARMMGIYYSPSALLLIAFGFILLILLHFSVVVSKLAEHHKELVQHCAILAWQVSESTREGQSAALSAKKRDVTGDGAEHGAQYLAR